MSYFNIPIDNDITYLLKEIGHNIKVNNVNAKAIINNASLERTYDDKKIITHEELKRGQYINYNNLFFILLNEVNDKRYLTYYKGLMRRCNFSIKFIVNDRLFQFPSIIESENLYLSDDYLMPKLKHTLTVTLPLTPITKELKVEQSFMKWGQKWQIQGRDYTKDGLVVLNCERTGSSHNDDKENEIADRYVEVDGQQQDRLNGNINPILPFDVIATEIVSIQGFSNIEVEFGTDINDIELPILATVTLDDTTQVELNIIWNTSSYIPDVEGVYTLIGEIELIEGIANSNNIKAEIKVAVDEKIEEGAVYEIEVEKQYQGDTDYQVTSNNWQKYTIKKMVAGVEVPGNFDFALSDDLGGLTLTKENNSSCKLSSPTLYGGAIDIMLVVTDTDIDEIVIEKTITVKRR